MVLRNESPRPSFLIPRVLQATGAARPLKHYGGLGIYGQVIPDGQAVDTWWAAFEHLAFTLALAGYDTPEIVVGYLDDPTYLRLLSWPGVVPDFTEHLKLETGDWKALTGAEEVLGEGHTEGRVIAALRVRARRWLEQPVQGLSPYPALALSGVVSAYIADGRTPAVEPADPFATPDDGWIVLSQPVAFPTQPAAIAGSAREASDALAKVLTAPAGTGRGLLRRLEPAVWTSALQRPYPLDAFTGIAGEIWRHVNAGSGLGTLLGYDLDAPNASALNLLASGRNTTVEVLRRTGAFEPARQQLLARHAALYPRDPNGPAMLARFESMHWVLLLFVLHEYGLIDLLPFGVLDPTILPPQKALNDLPPLDLTGLYETDWDALDADGRVANLTLQINQAGGRLDGWIADRQLFRHEFTAAVDPSTWRPSEGTQEALLRFDGTFDEGGFISLYDLHHPDDDGTGAPYALAVGFALGDDEMQDFAVVRQQRRARLRPSLIGQTLPADVVTALDLGAMGGTLEPWQTPRGLLEADVTPMHSTSWRAFERGLSVLILDLNASFTATATTSLDTTAQKIIAELAGAGVLDIAAVPALSNPALERFRRQARVQLTLAERVRRDDVLGSPQGTVVRRAGDVTSDGRPPGALARRAGRATNLSWKRSASLHLHNAGTGLRR